MGSSPAGARKHILWCEFEQHTFSPPKYLPWHYGVASIRYHALWGTGCVLSHNVVFCCSRNSACFCKKLRLYEYHRCLDTAYISLLTTLVWKSLWTCASQLLNPWISGRPRAYRRALRYCLVHARVYEFTHGLRCFSFHARWKCYNWSIIYGSCIP